MSDDLITIPAVAKEIVKHKRTGKVYDSNTDTTVDDFQQDLEIKVAKLELVSKTKE